MISLILTITTVVVTLYVIIGLTVAALVNSNDYSSIADGVYCAWSCPRCNKPCCLKDYVLKDNVYTNDQCSDSYNIECVRKLRALVDHDFYEGLKDEEFSD